MTLEKVKKINTKYLGVKEEKIKPESNFVTDLGADSIDAVQIIMDLEDTFGIEIDTDNADAIATVGNLVDYIESLTK